MNQIGLPAPFAQRMSDPFALFELFGFRNVRHILGQSQALQAPQFDRVHRACKEIWDNRRNPVLTEHDESTPGWDNTRELVRQSRPASLPPFLKRVQRCCHLALPFPAQQLLLDGFSPEAEEEKQKALVHLFTSLEAEPVPSAPDDLWNLMRLYYSQGALVINRTSYYFSDLVFLWNRQIQQRLVASFPCQPLLPPLREPAPFTERQEETFPQCLARCSVVAFERNCQIALPDSFRAALQALFQQHESLRADAAYVSVDLPRLYELDLTSERWKNRPSAPLLRSVQALYFHMQREGVRARQGGAILERLFQAGERGNPYKLPDFATRKWDRDLVDRNSQMDAVFIAYNRLLQQISRKELASIYQEDPCCTPLLYLLLSSPSSLLAIGFFTRAAESGRFAITSKILYDFCLRNLPVMKTADAWQIFSEDYLGAIDALQVKTGAEGLFLHPPLQLPHDWTRVNRAKRLTKPFADAMQPYQRPEDRKYVIMFHHFLFHNTAPLFSFLRDTPVLGMGPPSPALLEWALTSSHGPVTADVLPQIRGEIARAVRQLRENHGFRDTETFSLYLDLLRTPKWQEMIGRSASLIAKLKELCPALMRESIYFLFRYHPDVSLLEVDALLKLQMDWASNQAVRDPVVIHPRHFSQVFEPVKRFVELAASSCPAEEEKVRFGSAFLQSVLGGFLAPLQPLTDFFRITGLSPQGIKWAQPIWSTHLGQVTFVLPRAAVGIYFHWTIQANQAVLFFSFPNLSARRSQSLFLPLEFPLSALDSREKEEMFYSFLIDVSQQALREETDREVGPGEDWTHAYTGLPESIARYQELLPAEFIAAVLAFMAQLRRSYRKLFLDTVQDTFTPTVFTPGKMAASGSIFPSHPRGALLPKALFECEPEPKWYIPDASEQFAAGCLRTFQERNRQPELLSLDLQVKGLDPLPISYHVQSADDLTEAPLAARREWNERAPPREQTEGTYVTLSVPLGCIRVPLRYPPEALDNPRMFQEYMDYHLLVLKGFVYRLLQVTRRLPQAQRP